MQSLKQNLQQITQFITDPNDVILVDYPQHYNVGDLLIFLGEIEFLESQGIIPKFYLGTFNTSVSFLKKHVTPNTTILCHGGGNFGDLYVFHQKLRESILKNFPNNRVIILPQTAYFANNDNLKRSQKIFKAHQNVVLFARDEESLNILKGFSDKAFLSPDMAHALYGTLPKSAVKNNETLYFLREDIEKNPIQDELEASVVKNSRNIDWEDLMTRSDNRYLSFLHTLSKINRVLKSDSLNNAIYRSWFKKIKKMVDVYSEDFSQYHHVTTSRLHGHIFACLLDIPSTVIDNSYGKNSTYYNRWTKQLHGTSLMKKSL